MNQKLAESNARGAQCQQQVNFLKSVESNLEKTQTELKTATEQVVLLRNQVVMSNNESSQCKLEVAQVGELKRRIQQMEGDNTEMDKVTQ